MKNSPASATVIYAGYSTVYMAQSVGAPPIWCAEGSGLESRRRECTSVGGSEVHGADESGMSEFKGGGNGRVPTKPTNQRHRPARCKNPAATPRVIEPGIALVEGEERSNSYATTAPLITLWMCTCVCTMETLVCGIALTACAYDNHRDSGASKWKKTAVVNKMAGRFVTSYSLNNKTLQGRPDGLVSNTALKRSPAAHQMFRIASFLLMLIYIGSETSSADAWASSSLAMSMGPDTTEVEVLASPLHSTLHKESRVTWDEVQCCERERKKAWQLWSVPRLRQQADMLQHHTLHPPSGAVLSTLLASHLGEPVSIPGGVAPGLSHVGESCQTMSLGDGFSRELSPPPPILQPGAAPYLTPLPSPSSALNTSITRPINKTGQTQQSTMPTRHDGTIHNSAGMQGRGKRENHEKTRRPAASPSTIPTCESEGGEQEECEGGEQGSAPRKPDVPVGLDVVPRVSPLQHTAWVQSSQLGASSQWRTARESPTRLEGPVRLPARSPLVLPTFQLDISKISILKEFSRYPAEWLPKNSEHSYPSDQAERSTNGKEEVLPLYNVDQNSCAKLREEIPYEKYGGGDPRENPPTSGILRHETRLRQYGENRPGIEPGLTWWEASRSAPRGGPRACSPKLPPFVLSSAIHTSTTSLLVNLHAIICDGAMEMSHRRATTLDTASLLVPRPRNHRLHPRLFPQPRSWRWFANIRILRVYESEARRVWSSAGTQGRRKWEIPEKTRPPAASTATCENPGSDPAGTGMLRYPFRYLYHKKSIDTRITLVPYHISSIATSVRQGIEPSSPWWEASSLAAAPVGLHTSGMITKLS
ncbi:hypothetical protein PR048_004005 [Dryococelus australis]|uniref:Uncharacterized protein n=1 Tax=Dryococelus australis TaxID=614101 RepID=A0ABQ9I4A9_9NEOP|nr:hypothetical protein PR048_004005 [Dryococelus australis]